MKLNGGKNSLIKKVWAWIQNNIDQLYIEHKYQSVVQQIKDKCQSSTIPTEYIKRKLCDYLYDLASE